MLQRVGQEVNGPPVGGEPTACPSPPSIRSDSPITGYVSEADIITIQSDSDTDRACESKVDAKPPLVKTPVKTPKPWVKNWEHEGRVIATFSAQHSGNPYKPSAPHLLTEEQEWEENMYKACRDTLQLRMKQREAQLQATLQKVVSPPQEQLSPEQRGKQLNKDFEEATVASLLQAIDASHNRHYTHKPLQEKLEAQREDWHQQLKEICSTWEDVNPLKPFNLLEDKEGFPTIADATSGREGKVTKPESDPTDLGHGSLPSANYYVATGKPQKPWRQYTQSPA